MFTTLPPILLVGPASDDLERVVGQRASQRLRLVPRRSHPQVPLFIRRQVTDMALRGMGSTMELGAVVRKPRRYGGREWAWTSCPGRP
jgi:hypothetical protein